MRTIFQSKAHAVKIGKAKMRKNAQKLVKTRAF